MRKNVLAMGVAAMIGGLAMTGNALAMGSTGGVPAATATDIRNVGVSAAPLWTQGATDGTATVLQVNGDHIGHMLVVPYFSAQDNNDTYLNITNTDTVRGKAVKVRFRGAANSDDVFDFQVLMSPGDMWTAAITRNDDGKAILRTSDKSCTLPSSLSGTEFILTRVDGSLATDAKVKQVKEGYVEIINMADIPPTALTGTGAATGSYPDTNVPATTGVTVNTNNDLYDVIKHVNGVASCGTTTFGRRVLDNLAVDPVNEAAARGLGLDNPTTGLTASWVILNTESVNTFSGVATAIEARVAADVAATPGVDAGNVVFFPQTRVNVGVAQGDVSTADALYITGAAGATIWNSASSVVSVGTAPIVQPLRWDFPDLSTPYTPGVTAATQALNVSAALAVDSVANEYVLSPSINANTDWVFSMPTRRYAVAVDYGVSPTYTARMIYNANVDDYFTPTVGSVAGNVTFQDRKICVRNVNADQGYYDREERQPAPVVEDVEFGVSPGIPDQAPTEVVLCGEAAVLTFASGADKDNINAGGVSTLRAEVAQGTVTLADGYQTGWTAVSTTGLGRGLPVTGYAAARYEGNGNYGSTWAHRVVRAVIN